jgi:hypothetical protein
LSEFSGLETFKTPIGGGSLLKDIKRSIGDLHISAEKQTITFPFDQLERLTLSCDHFQQIEITK